MEQLPRTEERVPRHELGAQPYTRHPGLFMVNDPDGVVPRVQGAHFLATRYDARVGQACASPTERLVRATVASSDASDLPADDAHVFRTWGLHECPIAMAIMCGIEQSPVRVGQRALLVSCAGTPLGRTEGPHGGDAEPAAAADAQHGDGRLVSMTHLHAWVGDAGHILVFEPDDDDAFAAATLAFAAVPNCSVVQALPTDAAGYAAAVSNKVGDAAPIDAVVFRADRCGLPALEVTLDSVLAAPYVPDGASLAIVVAAATIDATAAPAAVFASVCSVLRRHGIKLREQVTLEPFGPGMAMIAGVVKRKP